MQDGQSGVEREIRPGFDARVMPALRLIVADDGHVIRENPAEPRVHQLLGAVLLGGRTRHWLDFETPPNRVVDLGDRTSHGLISRIGPVACAAALAVSTSTPD